MTALYAATPSHVHMMAVWPQLVCLSLEQVIRNSGDSNPMVTAEGGRLKTRWTDKKKYNHYQESYPNAEGWACHTFSGQAFQLLETPFQYSLAIQCLQESQREPHCQRLSHACRFQGELCMKILQWDSVRALWGVSRWPFTLECCMWQTRPPCPSAPSPPAEGMTHQLYGLIWTLFCSSWQRTILKSTTFTILVMVLPPNTKTTPAFYMTPTPGFSKQWCGTFFEESHGKGAQLTH